MSPIGQMCPLCRQPSLCPALTHQLPKSQSWPAVDPCRELQPHPALLLQSPPVSRAGRGLTPTSLLATLSSPAVGEEPPKFLTAAAPAEETS